MNNKIDKINQFITTVKEMMGEGKFKNDYVNLYKYLVGYSRDSLENEDLYWKEIAKLETHIAESKSKGDFNSAIFINKDSDWMHIEAELPRSKRLSFKRLVKLYVPVEYSELPRIARIIFDYLFARKNSFYLKVAYKNRRDNICIWITKSDIEEVVAFLQSLIPAILPAPLFCPEYHHFGITRELYGSFNEVIADTLFKYAHAKRAASFTDYIQFIEQEVKFENIFEFDKKIVLRSLKCIANNECPVAGKKFSVIDFNLADATDE